MPDVEVAVPAFRPRVQAVLRLHCTVQRGRVNRMSPGVATYERETTPRALCQGDLYAVIVGRVSVFKKVDKP